MFTFPYDVLPGEPPMKSPIFFLLYVFGTIAACTFFLWYGGAIAAAAAESGLDTAKIESITGLKGARNVESSKKRRVIPESLLDEARDSGPLAYA
jgi:hypothetical protein